MFIHAVYFWLRPDLSAEDRAKFVRGANAMRTIDSVKYGWVGTPASTDRPIIDRSYSYALTVVFDDEAGHDRYQTHPVHDQFREECSGFWERVLIYDSVSS